MNFKASIAKRLFVFVLILFSISCDDADDVISTPVGGRCYITDSGTEILCIEFADGSDANTNASTCNTEFSRYQASNGATGSDFASGDGNNCTQVDAAGSCTVGSNRIFYFNTEFNSTTAEADCTGVQGGTWD